MAVQPPPPPSITPGQMNLLRIVAHMAWSDGQLATEEVDLMLNRFSSLFAKGEQQQQQLKEELSGYLMQNIPLEKELINTLDLAEKQLALRLGYEVIACSARTPDEPNINEEEKAAYQNLKELLELPGNLAELIEGQVNDELKQQEGIIDMMTRDLEKFIQS